MEHTRQTHVYSLYIFLYHTSLWALLLSICVSSVSDAVKTIKEDEAALYIHTRKGS